MGQTWISNVSHLPEEENKSDSEYVDATQLVEFVTETQIDPTLKAQVNDFLKDFWDNMEKIEKDNDNGANRFPDKDFQLVFNKKGRNKKSQSAIITRHRSSHNNLTLWISCFGILEVLQIMIQGLLLKRRFLKTPQSLCS